MTTRHPIPDAALESDIAILGKKGRGKSYTARGLVERLLDGGRQVVVLDPLSTWWGLKAGPNAYPIPVIGGPHGDLPIDDRAGEALGRYLATTDSSVVIDLGELRKAELVRFATPFLEELYTGNRKPIWLVLEEADVFAPQQPQPDTARLLGEVDRIARRGRAFGFRLISLTQRPARLNKDVLTQLSTLIALGITSPQDRDAVKAWIEGAGDRDKSKEVLTTLASLKVGEGWVWAPDQKILERVTFPKIRTLDTSATPKAGEKRPTAKLLKDVDVAALRAAMSISSSTNEEAKRDKALAQGAGTGGSLGTTPSTGDLAVAEHHGFVRGEQQGLRRGVAAGWKAAATLFERDIMVVANEFPATPDHEGAADEIARALGLPTWPGATAHETPAASPAPADPRREGPAGRKETGPKPVAVAKATGTRASLGAERRILAVLAGVYPTGMAEVHWAVAAGMKRSGGTWGTYKSRLRSAGAIEQRGDIWFATSAGLAHLGTDVPRMPAPGPALVAFWAERISGVGPMLRALAQHYPRALSRDALASVLDMTASGGTFGTYLFRLRGAGLVENVGKELRAAAALMGPP